MKKILLVIIINILLTGCSKYSDLNDLAIIKSIGISYNDKYTLYAEIISEIDDNKNPKMQVIQTDADDIKTLFDNIKLLVNKEIYLSHIDLMIIDFNILNNNYNELIPFFLNNKEIRNDFLCVLSKDILNVLNNSKYDEIEKLIVTNRESKNVINISFEDIMKLYLDNEKIYFSSITYDKEVKFNGNYVFWNNKYTEDK